MISDFDWRLSEAQLFSFFHFYFNIFGTSASYYNYSSLLINYFYYLGINYFYYLGINYYYYLGITSYYAIFLFYFYVDCFKSTTSSNFTIFCYSGLVALILLLESDNDDELYVHFTIMGFVLFWYDCLHFCVNEGIIGRNFFSVSVFFGYIY
jgi:hypothetical protein